MTMTKKQARIKIDILKEEIKLIEMDVSVITPLVKHPTIITVMDELLERKNEELKSLEKHVNS